MTVLLERSAGIDITPVVRLVTCGSVDDGKSTLIGRLLAETGSIPEDQLEYARQTRRGGSTIPVGEVDFSHGNRRTAAPGLPGVLELILEDRPRLGEEAADQGGLAVIDGTTRDQSDDGSDVDSRRAFEERGHQK